jgi:hypothetical protein
MHQCSKQLAMQAVLEKNILGAISQFSCPELPKPIKIYAER